MPAMHMARELRSSSAGSMSSAEASWAMLPDPAVPAKREPSKGRILDELVPNWEMEFSDDETLDTRPVSLLDTEDCDSSSTTSAAFSVARPFVDLENVAFTRRAHQRHVHDPVVPFVPVIQTPPAPSLHAVVSRADLLRLHRYNSA
eukprot:TRINITY_DN6360_c0_g1_i1.p2 TRINITY_DN6360_c0_g1~~TRINITY_DN6360_c0_g1_i1.p2  ORF type:complete len:146 (+),score=32.87 TRINITY_DN6360_c0_g1_i1:58-495(+)